MDIILIKWWWLIVCAIGGMGLSGYMAWNDGVLKLYNDIPSMIGYLSLALIVYKTGVVIKTFFEWSDEFSYELYLVHSLIFSIVFYYAAEKISLALKFFLGLIAAYIIAYCFRIITRKITITK